MILLNLSLNIIKFKNKTLLNLSLNIIKSELKH